jgi:replication factor A1
LNDLVHFRPDVKPVAVARSYPAPNSPSAFSAGSSNAQAPSSPWAQQSNRLAQSGRGPVSDASGSAILPIASITAYQSRWTIKARCTSKAPVKTYRNAKGDGKLMSVEFSDAQGSSIRATMFNATVDKFDPILEIGKVYLCSNMQAKPANKQFNNTGHEYELTVNDSSTIMPVEDDSSIKEISVHFFSTFRLLARSRVLILVCVWRMQYNLTGIADLVNLSAGASADVLGIVSNVGAVSSITTKKGEPLSRRTVSLYDQTSKSVCVFLSIY